MKLGSKTAKLLKLLFKMVFLAALLCIAVFLFVLPLLPKHLPLPSGISGIPSGEPTPNMFRVQSIDTMKYSRDVSRQVLDDPAKFQPMIEMEMRLIKEAGATHVGIATPYDERFVPVLKLWVGAARREGLGVWFRGNFSGWEGWFEYKKITRETHKKLLKEFIRENPDIFADGDLFSPCPECENGAAGDPRRTGDHAGYNEFLIEERRIALKEFDRLGKSLEVYTSMNGDIAREIITPDAAKDLGGIILIDHYVRTPEQFGSDVRAIGEMQNAQVGLGEFGAPIPDLQGRMTEQAQAKFVGELLHALYLQSDNVPVVNYWTLRGGSTSIVRDNGSPKPAYETLKHYFQAPFVYGVVENSLGEPLGKVTVSIEDTPYSSVTDAADGNYYKVFLPDAHRTISISKEGYATTTVTLPNILATSTQKNFVLEPTDPSWRYKTRHFLYSVSERWAQKWRDL